MTRPIFILSSGRSGSQMMERLISQYNDVEVHHEYLCNIIQPLATKYVMGLVDKKTVRDIISSTYSASLKYSKKSIWVDSSNKISWLIKPLKEIFSDAKFIHLIRDGRRVTSSYFNKLNDECYKPECVRILYDSIYNDKDAPPPEKKYWWPILKYKGKESNFMKLNQYEQICVHWSEINNYINNELSGFGKSESIQIKLEELTQSIDVFRNLINFTELPYRPAFFETLKTPHNVNIPKSFSLNANQEESFWKISKETMDFFNYLDKEDYEVRY